MKVTICENEAQQETEVVIHCKQADDEVLHLAALLSTSTQKLAGVKDGKTFLLEPREILYFDSVDKKTFAYTATDVYEISLRLYELEQCLPTSFFRASKASIVNIDKITSIQPDFGSRLKIALINSEKLTVSRQYAQALKSKLQ
ncbi:LytTR family transcriptional regulator DNA-binding domain-containing protein [Ruminococcaceae bacterium OttesenSCG-928-L11]|nr:LytTR family transcriptional regulator DNA-binding domain-containing protein [Ruminococcaceae bacterium OttesenSCG-928-L11]